MYLHFNLFQYFLLKTAGPMQILGSKLLNGCPKLTEIKKAEEH